MRKMMFYQSHIPTGRWIDYCKDGFVHTPVISWYRKPSERLEAT